MSSLVRLLTLVLCGTLGVGIAICLATSARPEPLSLATPAPLTTAEPVADEPQTHQQSIPAQSEDRPTPSETSGAHKHPNSGVNDKQPPEQRPSETAATQDEPSAVVAQRPQREGRPKPREQVQVAEPREPVMATAQPPFAQQPVPPGNQDLINRLETAIGNLQDQGAQRQETINRTLEALQGMTGAAVPNLALPAAPPAPATTSAGAEAVSTPRPTGTPPRAGSPRPTASINRIEGEGDDQLSIQIQDSDIREVLELLSEQGGLNILASNSVQGKVSASLTNVDIDTALSAILKSTGYTARREGRFVYVGTTRDFQAMDESVDKVGARIYRPNYIKASELQTLIQPLLTPDLGVCSVTSPADVGIGADSTTAGGDTFAGGEAVLVRDFEAVLAQVDQVCEELDQRPMQVSIEAMILSVKLADRNAFGVDFALLRDESNARLVSGSPLADLGAMKFDGGLKFGFLDSSLGVFLNALETIGDTNVIATPRLMCINKHRAEILIGAQLGYVNTTLTETSTAQNVQFLEIGTQLRLRPFISNDGLIRMEVHPELSTGSVRVVEGFTLPDKEVTQVTTNIMVRDGCTVIIGGLMREDLSTTTSQIPLLGSMPGVGFLFRQKSEQTDRRELIVLITPHIVYEPQAAEEGVRGAGEFHRRQSVYADHMSPIGTRYLGRKYFRIAQDYWARGEGARAVRAVNLAINFDPLNRAAIDLRSDIMAGSHLGDHSGGNGVLSGNNPPTGPPPGPTPGAPPGVLEPAPGTNIRPIMRPTNLR